MDENLSAKIALLWFLFMFALFVPVKIALVRKDFAAVTEKKGLKKDLKIKIIKKKSNIYEK